jgi:sigma-B regulation protein RsbQ
MATDVIKRNNVKVFGQGTQPMVFAHGFGCDQNMWRSVTPAFEDDYKVVLFDYVGAGKSDVVEICEALDLRDVILVGHSVSSMIGVLAAQAAPDRISRLVMVGPSPRYINDTDYVGGFERADIEGLLEMMDKNYIGWANFLAPAIIKNPDQPGLAQELTESFCSTDPGIARRFAEATFFADNRADLASIVVPSLILQCSDDIIAPLAVGEYLHRNVPGSTLRVMKATGHCPHMSHPDETIELIQDYLREARAA